MSYKVVITEEAAKDLAALPVSLRNALKRELSRLADDPVRSSRRSVSPPYPPGQMYQFECVVRDRRHLLTVLFRYSSDERTLVIFGIGRQELD